MKTACYIIPMILTIGSALAGPKEDLQHNSNIRRVTAGLFRQGKPVEAMAYVSANVRAVTPGKAGVFSTAESLIAVAFALKGSRQGAVAATAANQALAIIASLPPLRGHDADRAELLYSAGLLCERVLLDANRGEQLYRSALALNPANRLASERLKLFEKRKIPGRS